MPVQPANPEPLHSHNDGMLARKFGREVANYFAGNPLNRVAFLRGDHTFLSQALHHPSTRYLPCNELQPLVETGKPAGEGRVAWLKYDDVKSIVGDDPFATTEKDQIEAYNSDRYVPQMVFLGIDEAGGKGGEGLSYTTRKNTYTGVPHFAVDVTPRKSVKEACEQLIKDQEGKGRKFAGGRVMDVVASDGMFISSFSAQATLTVVDSRHLRRSAPTPRLERAQPFLRWLRAAHTQRQRRLQAHLPTQRRCAQGRLRPPGLRNSSRNLQPLLPSHRPHRHHGHCEQQRRQTPAWSTEALAAVLVLDACWVRGARGID